MAREIKSLIPWLIEDAVDLCEANGGEPEFTRDLMVNGQTEHHVGLMVTGTYDRSLVLGLIAIRCERRQGKDWPMGIAIPETPIVVPEKKPAMDVTLLSAPVRRSFRGDPDVA